LALRRGDAAAAARWFDRALLEEPRPGVAAMHAAILASANQYDLAIAHLDRFTALPPQAADLTGMPRVHAWVLARQAYWPDRLAELRKAIVAERDKTSATARERH